MFPGVPFNDDGAQLYPYELSRLGCFSSKVAPSPSASLATEDHPYILLYQLKFHLNQRF